MGEADFLLFHYIAAELEVLLSAVCMTVFFLSFVSGKERLRKEKRLPFEAKKLLLIKALSIFLVYTGIYSANLWSPVSVNGWICMLAVAALSEAIPGFAGLEKRNLLLLDVLFFSVRYMSMLITESLHYIMTERFLETAESVEVIFLGSVVIYSIVMALKFVLFVLMLYIVRRCFPDSRWELQRKELCYLCLIPVAGILFGNIILRLFIVVKEDAFFRMYEQYPAFIGLVPLVVVLFYAGTLATIASYREMVEMQEEKKKYFVKEQQLSALRDRMEEVERFYEGLSRIKHEMRNHLTNIRGLAVKGEYRDMEEYISQMTESMNAFEFTVKTGNAVIDVIVNDKLKAAQKAGIRFQAEFAYPTSEGYNAYDIGIIVHNLLQNALEACERMMSEGPISDKDRFIMISGRRKKKFFLIEVRNSFQGEVIFDDKTELPLSVKGKDPFSHGIGLSNVKREAEKYMGDVDIRVEGREFCVDVLLQERRSHEA